MSIQNNYGLGTAVELVVAVLDVGLVTLVALVAVVFDAVVAGFSAWRACSSLALALKIALIVWLSCCCWRYVLAKVKFVSAWLMAFMDAVFEVNVAAALISSRRVSVWVM